MALAGDLSEFPLTDIIQLVQLSKQTGGVHIRGQRAGRTFEGWIYFRDGKIIGAAMPGLQPLEAVYTFFTLVSGPFRFHDDKRIDAPTITVSNEVIIMEGVMRQDAWTRIHEHIPSMAAVPRLVLNPTTGSSEINLEPEEWRVLTMVDGRNKLVQIAQRSGLGEFRTCEIVVQLLQNGLIEMRETSPGERLAPEFERIAAGFVGAGASALLEEAYRLAGIPDPSRASGDQMLAVVEYFERGAAQVVDPLRAREAASQLRARASQLLA
ncbi:MAG: DUF4388 domain-containing protein [Chloroflexales bacterium]|nr:DUF4388 domain-containing protein [Chloroflexales bacterium]